MNIDKINRRKITIARGTTRDVILFYSIVVKIPSTRSYTAFLYGLLSNINESRVYRTIKNTVKREDYAPILSRSYLGLILVMKRARVLTLEEGQTLGGDILTKEELEGGDNYHYNYGKIKDKIVKIDYGGTY